MSLSIALLTYSTKPRGGVVHTLALAEALAAAGQDVTVWTLGRGGDTRFFRPVDPAVTLRIVPFPDVENEGVGPRILRSIEALQTAFDARPYDIVHAQDCITANAAGPCIRTVHHLDTFTTPELASCHEKAIVSPYAHVCVSTSVADELADGWGIEATVIPNGVDAARFAAADGTEFRARFGRYVLAVGGIEPRKGSVDLLEAYALLLRSEPDVRLVIAGGETLFDYRDYRVRWQDRARELGVSPVVLGPVDHDVLPGVVAGAAVFAFPSVKEGFGMAALEAAAAGVPLVLRDLPVFREVFGSVATYAGSVVELAEAFSCALSASPGEGGRLLAARYSWQAAALAHLRFYGT